MKSVPISDAAMPIYATQDTIQALGGPDLRYCTSRSLYQSRFADPQAKDEARKNWFEKLKNRPAESKTAPDWLPACAAKVHARLMSRLMVDLGGGVMENAHVNLDRFGLPIIPGSAVKGCARRMALRALHDWVAAGSDRPAAEDACAPSCEGFNSPADMLAAIAAVFGWVAKDWEGGKKDGLFRSDFAWACGEHYEPIWEKATSHIAERFHWTLPAQKPWQKLPSFAGAVAFLPASPSSDPGLELDVVTPHHTKYYKGELETATDTENPIPVYFPAVKPQNENEFFTFPIIPLARSRGNDAEYASRWLGTGLELHGLGAKTNAGYGWFKNVTADVEEAAAKADQLRTVQNDPSIAEQLRAKPKEQLRGILNKFEFDERFWPQQEPESTYSFQLTLLQLHLDDPALLAEALALKKSKKALTNLARKFNLSLP